jgi:hypothetical protein
MPISSTTLVPGANYEVVGTADFNGDGTPDILWQNVTTGEASIWYMNGTTRIGGGPITNANSSTALQAGSSWQIVPQSRR